MKRWVIATLAILVLAGGGVAWWQYDSHHKTTNKPANGSSQTTAPVTTPPASGMQPSNETPKAYLVKVYFSKHPDSDNDPSAVFAVTCTSSDLGVAKSSITELLKGPTASEQASSYFTTARLRDSASNCGGADFTIAIKDGTATLQFCRPFDHLGVVADGQAKSELEATLKQFGSVKKVVILNYKGDCEFDLSGMNLCKQ